jgi:hypothetical protein
MEREKRGGTDKEGTNRKGIMLRLDMQRKALGAIADQRKTDLLVQEQYKLKNGSSKEVNKFIASVLNSCLDNWLCAKYINALFLGA